MIKGIIFDLDGVITDTAESHYEAWKRMAEEEGMQFDRNLNEQLKGVSRSASIDLILQHNNRTITEEEKEVWMTRKNDYYVETLSSISKDDYLPGVEAFLSDIQSAGLKIGLGSASKNAPKVLDGLDATPFFQVIGDGNSVVKSKPAPDLFLFVANELGLEPNECVVIEDAEAGIQAAHSAGMKAIGIGPQGYTANAEITLDDTSLLKLEVLEQL